MATTFPEGLDSFLNPQPTDSVAAVSHAAQHADANDAIEALQAKLGVDNSLDTSSIDYRIKALEDQPFDSEAVRDAVDLALVAGSGITKLYEDSADTLTLSVDTSVIATKEFATNEAAGALTDANEYTDFAVASLGNNLPNIYVPLSSVGSIDGVASLGPDGKVPSSELNITETIQDVAAEMITGATHTNISVSYDDNTGKLSFTASGGGSSLTQEEVQDFVAPLLNHAFHTNITATYDDANNRIVLQGNSGSGGGASVIISPTPPSTPGLGDIWLDSDNGKTYIWDGAYWIEVGGSSSQAVAAVNSIPPSSPVLGSIWMNSSTAKTYIYDGSFWAQI